MKKSIVVLLFLSSFALQSESADYKASTSVSTTENAAPVAPDNTEINRRDDSSNTLTPADQSNSKADLRISSAIRNAIVNSDASVIAKNVKIITISGDVTLRGPVQNQAEKDTIARVAAGVAGVRKVTNLLEVKTVSHTSE